MDAAIMLLKTHWPLDKKAPIRALTVGVTHLCSADAVTEQVSFFGETETGKPREQREKLEKTIDALREKLGNNAVSFGFPIRDDDEN